MPKPIVAKFRDCKNENQKHGQIQNAHANVKFVTGGLSQESLVDIEVNVVNVSPCKMAPIGQKDEEVVKCEGILVWVEPPHKLFDAVRGGSLSQGVKKAQEFVAVDLIAAIFIDLRECLV